MASLAYLGSPEAAVPPLRALVEAGHDIRVVVSRRDTRRGRGSLPSPSPVKQAALDLGLEVTDDMEDVVHNKVELAVVVAFGRIIPARLLEAVPMLNAHFSILPRWRGAAPVERAILAGDSVSGVSVMRIEEGLDTGPVVAQSDVLIDNAGREHAGALRQRLSLLAATLLVQVLAGGVSMIGPGEAQVGEATYAPKIEPDELRLDFTCEVDHLERLVRLDRAWTTFRGERLLVLDAVAHKREAPGAPDVQSGGPSRVLQPGEAPGRLRGTLVSAVDGALELLEVQPAGRRALSASDWARGARISDGETLGS